jgi:Second BRCT domain on Nijmegen syndrome breakage protein/FHA domain
MWILESSGDFLQGKRMWLRPGRKYLFGRVKKDGVSFAIDHKTVSRKHFIIDVAKVAEGEVTQIHARTKIKIIDQNSKSGTSVDGHVLKGDNLLSRDLTDAENSIRPGSLPQELLIRWQPCVLTLHLPKKDLKSGVLKAKQDRLRPLGVKAISDFVPDHTTHLVADKRNTPKGLQALTCGKYLVSDSYIDALEYASTPTNLDEEEDASPLERDFEKAWPAPKDHLPPAGREPTIRPVERYQPDPTRVEIFKDYTFVFGDETQYDNLLPVITTGHGKALHFKVVYGETTVDEAYTFMSNAAGRKGFGDAGDKSEKGGVVMVRWNAPAEHVEWATELINQLAIKLDQRAIDQSEFLDAILASDATLLRQSIPFESNVEGRVAPPSSAAQSFASIQQPTQPQSYGERSSKPKSTRSEPHLPQSLNGGSTSASKTPATRPETSPNGRPASPGVEENTETRPKRDRSRIPLPTQKTFDDGFDPDAIIDYDDEDEAMEASQFDEELNAPIKNEPPSTRKRRRSPSPNRREQSLADDMDELLPAATAMKRRRIELEAEAKRKGLPAPFASPATTAVKKPKKPEKEIDIREIARAQREKEEEQARREREQDERLPPQDENDREPANLTVIEYVELPVRESKPVSRAGKNPEDDPRWDPRWNGRKNFKKFRPQEAGAARKSDRATKVIVSVVPVKKNTGGLGDQYWPKSQEDKSRDREKKQKEKQRSQKTQSSTSPTQMQSARGTGSTRRLEEVVSDDEGDQDQARQTNPAPTRLQEEAAAIVDHEIDLESPRRTRGDDARSQTQRQTQTQGTKRPAPAGKAAQANKRQKTLPVTTVHGSDSEVDDDDDLKFKFGSRRRKGKA